MRSAAQTGDLMPYVQVGSEQLFFTRGKPHGALRLAEPIVVLIHGAGGSHLTWPAELRRLGGVTVYALDLPGHSKSEGPGRSSILEYTNVVIGFLDALHIERAIFTGHSMGGAIAQQMALSYPSRVAGLILVATGARLRVAPVILERVLTDYDATLDLMTSYAWGPDAPNELVRLGRRNLALVGAQVAYGDYVACNTFDVMEHLGQIAAPTLVINGTADQLTPAKYATTLAERIPGAKLHLVENAGHMVMLEQPGQVAQVTSDFLSALSGPVDDMRNAPHRG
jgi:3-oxoadipate enol-lactonase